jgi:hypothetical protein
LSAISAKGDADVSDGEHYQFKLLVDGDGLLSTLDHPVAEVASGEFEYRFIHGVSFRGFSLIEKKSGASKKVRALGKSPRRWFLG